MINRKLKKDRKGSVRAEKKMRMLVIGLDCAPPELLFEQWRYELPSIARLIEGGVWGKLESCIPAITVPAWSSMLTGKDPGVLGCYGFRNRGDYNYDRYQLASSNTIREDRVWDLLSRAGKRVITVGVPQTYPPQPVHGIQVGCFLSPSTSNQARPFTYPPSAMQEISHEVGEYLVDVPVFRTRDKDFLLQQIYTMTERRFKLVRKWLVEKVWDLFLFVEMGTDRIHHGFWSYHDPSHRNYSPHPIYNQSIYHYYRYLDQEIGRLLERIDEETVVCLISDHGAKKMEGGICINEWLRREGYLTLHMVPNKLTPIDQCAIDWSKTRVWSDGGYYARIFFNVAGREPEGCVPPEDVELLKEEIEQKLVAMTDPQGTPLNNRVYRPEKIYRTCNGVPPDLLVYFGDLSWRSVGSLGHSDIYTFENDTGPDDCNHARDGVVIRYDPTRPEENGGRQISGLQIMDIAPMILQQFGLPIPSDMQGQPF